jgi:hypothetical protein
LTVSDADPRCVVSLSPSQQEIAEGDVITLECIVIYSGNWAPTARWQHLDVNDEVLSGKAMNITTSTAFMPEKQLNFTWSVNVTRMTNGTKYRFTIYFDLSQKPIRTIANKAPDYNFTWTSDVLVLKSEVPTGELFALCCRMFDLYRLAVEFALVLNVCM